MAHLTEMLESQFKNKQFWSYLSTGKAPKDRKKYEVTGVSMDPDTGAPVFEYRSLKTGNRYSMDANRFLGMSKIDKKWQPRFTMIVDEPAAKPTPAAQPAPAAR